MLNYIDSIEVIDRREEKHIFIKAISFECFLEPSTDDNKSSTPMIELLTRDSVQLSSYFLVIDTSQR